MMTTIVVTDIVSFADCLVTRTDGEPAHRYAGREEILAADGDASAIAEFRSMYRFQEKLDELRLVRNRYGAHLDSAVGRDVVSWLLEIDSLDLSTTHGPHEAAPKKSVTRLG